MSYSAEVLSTNPVFYFRFEETSGTSILDEVSQTSLTGTPAWDLSQVGPDGLGSAVFPNEAGGDTTQYTWPVGSTTFSVEFWVRPGASAPYAQHVIIAEDYGTQGFRCGLDGSGAGRLWCGESGGGGEVKTDALPLDTWSYVVFTFDGTTARAYVDGALNATSDTLALTRTADKPVGILGGSGWDARDPADELAFHADVVLTDAQVLARYNAATAPPIALSLVSKTNNSIEFAWTDSDTWDFYQIERNQTVIDTVPGTQFAYTDSGLTSSTSFDYRVRGYMTT